MEDDERPRRKPWGRAVAAIVLAGVSSVVGFMFLWTGDCHSDLQCRARDAVLFSLAFGGWVILVVAAVATAVLRHRGSRRVRRPLNVALVLLCLLPFTPAAYATFRNGIGGSTAGGRERMHRDATRRIVSVVDTTAAAVLPGVAPLVETSPGTREGNDTGTCERVRYLVRFRVDVAKQDEVAAAVAAHWQSAGMTVNSTATADRPHVYAEQGELRFYFQRTFADRTDGTLEIGGGGPCLAV